MINKFYEIRIENSILNAFFIRFLRKDNFLKIKLSLLAAMTEN